MIVSIHQLKEKYYDYKDINGKIFRDVKNGNLIPLIKGLYETDASVPGMKLAQFIYGPSYLSFESALAYYGLIPETVYRTYTCSSYNKRKIKKYSNKFGLYVYRDVPKEVFPFCVNIINDDNYTFLIASPEKALCDKIYSISPLDNIDDIKKLIFEDLRIDESDFYSLNMKDIAELAPLYKSKNLNLLLKLVKEEIK